MPDFINPYNFIPLRGTPKRGENKETKKNKFTGVMEYSILTKTKLFIPNTSNSKVFPVKVSIKDNASDKEKEEAMKIKEKHKTYDFFSYADLSDTTKDYTDNFEMPVIPGSEIRGMFRSYYEILTNSCLSVIEEDEDGILSRRTVETFEPGLIEKNRNGTFNLYKAKDYLWRTEEANNRKDELAWEDGFYTRKCYKQSDEDLKEGNRVYFTERTRKNGKKGKPLATKVSGKANPSQKEGYIIKGEDGPELGNKGEKHCAHIFSKDDMIRGVDIDISRLKLVLKAYKENDKDKENKQKYMYQEYAEQLKFFLEEGNSQKYFPVYYSRVTENSKYVMLSPACITREIYENDMKTIVGEFCSCKDKENLCPACRLFGTLQKDFSYSSKIRFSDLKCQSENGSKISKDNVKNCYDKLITLPELSSPKLSSTEFYMKRPENAVFWTWDYYIDASGKIRKLQTPELNGRKFYWHQLENEISKVNQGERNMTIRPVGKHVIFTGKLYFKDITEDELRTLYWLLNCGEQEALNEKKYGYKLGSAKPLGLGSIATTVDRVLLRKVQVDSNAEEITFLEEPLSEELDWNKNGWEKSFFDKDILKNFRKMTQFDILSGKMVSYPKLEKQKDNTEGFQWFVNNRFDTSKKPQPPSPGKNKREKQSFKEYMIPMQEKLASIEEEYEDRKGDQKENKAKNTKNHKGSFQKKSCIWVTDGKKIKKQEDKFNKQNSKNKIRLDTVVENEKPTIENLKKYIGKYESVALPSYVREDSKVMEFVKENFKRVFIAKKGKQYDDGWQQEK